MRTKSTLAAAVAAGALAVMVPAAHADHVRPNLGIEVTAVDAATRTVQAIQHCTSPERAGRPATFTVARDISIDQFRPGAIWGVAVDPGNVILSTGQMPCQISPSGPPPGSGGEAFGPPPPGGEDGEPPAFQRGFLNRVWKFEVQIDSVEAGKLGATLERVMNMPKRFRSQDDELVDEDVIILVNPSVRVYGAGDGKRRPQRELQDADVARVNGKLLPPAKWQEDEDGQPVPTIRAKRIYIPVGRHRD